MKSLVNQYCALCTRTLGHMVIASVAIHKADDYLLLLCWHVFADLLSFSVPAQLYSASVSFPSFEALLFDLQENGCIQNQPNADT